MASGLQAALHSGVLEDGHALVQDEAAALVVTAALAPQRGDTLLDTCAAPGGKAAFASACMHAESAAAEDLPLAGAGQGGLVVAMDVSAARVGLLRKTAELWGLEGAFVIGACDLRAASSRTCASHAFRA